MYTWLFTLTAPSTQVIATISARDGKQWTDAGVDRRICAGGTAASGVAGSTVPANSILRRSRRTIISAANGGGKETQRRIFWDPLKGSMRDSPKRGEKSDGLDNQIKQTKQ